MSSDRYLSLRQKTLIWIRDGRQCRYCGTKKPPFEFDHVYPFSKGGETSISNMVIACKRCNRQKRDMVGIWPKPVGYFRKVPPQIFSEFLAILAVILWIFGCTLYFLDHWWGFYILIVAAVISFFSLYTKRIGSR